MRRREAGRGAVPAGLVATRHSGGGGAPPGSTRRPCQELADGSVGAFEARRTDESRARCRKRPRLARREAPACAAKVTSHKDFALFGAPSPSYSGRERRGKENLRLASETMKRQVPTMYAVKESTTRCKAKARRPGRAAVFCRFAGCNLWTGREQDRADATCNFCDTDFVGTDGPGGGKFATPENLAGACREIWRGNSGTPPYVVLTGGEPMLQVDEELIEALHGRASRSPSRPMARCPCRARSIGSA